MAFRHLHLWLIFIALPLVSFITVPLIFAALLFMKWPELASIFWWLADFSLQPVAWLGKSSVGAWFEFSAQWLPLVVIFAGGIFSQRVLPFRFFPALYLGIFVVFCSWQWRQHLPFFNTLLQQTLTFDGTVSTHSSSMAMKSGVTSLDASDVLEWRVDMLDVGHGLGGDHYPQRTSCAV